MPDAAPLRTVIARPARPDDFPAFRPRAPWLTGDLQTLRNFLRAGEGGPAGERLRFAMADGDVLLGALDRPAGPPMRPLAVLIHGLTGCESGSYMRHSSAALTGRGHPVLRLNLRGAGPARGLCRGNYHAGRTADLRTVLAQLPPDLAAGGVFLVGYSLGGNALLKLLGEGDLPVPVRAAASVSAPIDLLATCHRFMTPRNRVYHAWLLGRMKADALAAPELEPRWAEALARVRTTWDFDDLFVGPCNGWSGAAEYYRVNSAAGFLADIRTPTLLVHALDDPWIPGEAYIAFDWASNPALVPLLPQRGGHVGFHDAAGVWHDRCLLRFFDNFV